MSAPSLIWLGIWVGVIIIILVGLVSEAVEIIARVITAWRQRDDHWDNPQ